MKQKTTFERHPDTQAVIDCLRSVNETIEYREIARRTGLTSGRVKSVVSSARRVLLHEKIMFGCIRGEGLRRLSDVEKVSKSETNKKRMGRSATRAIRELDSVQAFDRLVPRDQLVATTNRTIFALTRHQLRQVPKEVTPAAKHAAPDISKLLALAKHH